MLFYRTPELNPDLQRKLRLWIRKKKHFGFTTLATNVSSIFVQAKMKLFTHVENVLFNIINILTSAYRQERYREQIRVRRKTVLHLLRLQVQESWVPGILSSLHNIMNSQAHTAKQSSRYSQLNSHQRCKDLHIGPKQYSPLASKNDIFSLWRYGTLICTPQALFLPLFLSFFAFHLHF